MKGKSKQEWLEKGYQMVSQNGFTNVNVESIARSLNKNKSSFYYYFGDWTGFEEALLQYHLQLAKEFAADASKCQSIIPDMIDLFRDSQSGYLFSQTTSHQSSQTRLQKVF
jgi:AcrR family transcriptional regulator